MLNMKKVKRNYKPYKNYIKDKVFELAQNVYVQSMIACDAANGCYQKEIDECNKKIKSSQNDMIWRVTDYYDIEMYEELNEDIVFGELNFDDYEKNVKITS